jgi:hypothetical protein
MNIGGPTKKVSGHLFSVLAVSGTFGGLLAVFGTAVAVHSELLEGVFFASGALIALAPLLLWWHENRIYPHENSALSSLLDKQDAQRHVFDLGLGKFWDKKINAWHSVRVVLCDIGESASRYGKPELYAEVSIDCGGGVYDHSSRTTEVSTNRFRLLQNETDDSRSPIVFRSSFIERQCRLEMLFVDHIDNHDKVARLVFIFCDERTTMLS